MNWWDRLKDWVTTQPLDNVMFASPKPYTAEDAWRDWHTVERAVALPPNTQFTPLPEPMRLEVIELKADDVLVLRVPGAVDTETCLLLKQGLESNFPGRTCVVLGDGMALDVLRETKDEVTP